MDIQSILLSSLMDIQSILLSSLMDIQSILLMPQSSFPPPPPPNMHAHTQVWKTTPFRRLWWKFSEAPLFKQNIIFFVV